MSASIMEHSKHRVNDIKLEPSRSRMLKAMKANTKGMHAIHAARRSFKVDPNLNSFTTSVEPFGLSLLLARISYSTDATNLSTGQVVVHSQSVMSLNVEKIPRFRSE